MTSVLSIDEINMLDKQIELLTDYKPITEHEVKMLCEKVIYLINSRQKKYSKRKVMFSR